MKRADDTYDTYISEFGEQLHAAGAVAAPRPQRRGRFVLAGAGAVALAVVVALLVAPSGERSPRLGVIAEAQAALAPQHDIIHVVTTTTWSGVAAGRPPITLEAWWADDPTRWRFAQAAMPDVRTAKGEPAGPLEVAYADGLMRRYDENAKTIEISRGRASGPRMGLTFVPIGGDATARLRSMLAKGTLRDGGLTTIDGKQARVLRGDDHPWGKRSLRTTVYIIDPETFAPLQVRVTSQLRTGGKVLRDVATTRVDRYERIALDDESAKLLTITPKGPVKERKVG